MPTFNRLVTLGIVFAVGYFVGTSGWLANGWAQDQAFDTADPVVESVRSIQDALQAAQDRFSESDRHTSATTGLNAFALAAGGLDTVADLDSGRGVDPETFAALYAGRASDTVKDHIKRDEEGRLTYKGELVRLYSESRLKQLFAERDSMTGIGGDL